MDKKKEADKIIDRYTLYTAGMGLIPAPLVSTLIMGGIQVIMIEQLARLYEVEFKSSREESVVGAFVGIIAGVSFYEFIPNMGKIASGIGFAVIGAVSTYAIGRAFARHFEQGGTLVDFDPADFRLLLKKEKETKTKLTNKTSLSMPSKKRLLTQLVADSEENLAILTKLQADLNRYKA